MDKKMGKINFEEANKLLQILLEKNININNFILYDENLVLEINYDNTSEYKNIIYEFIKHLNYIIKNNSHKINYTNLNNVLKITINKNEVSIITKIFNFITNDNFKKEKFSIAVLAKPTCNCNLKCSYCYDREAKNKFNKTVLSKEKIKKFIDILSNGFYYIDWIWHGGEVLLVGKEYLDEISTYIRNKESIFRMSLMSNGILWDDDWFKVFEKNNISFSSSYNLGNQCRLREVGLHKNKIFSINRNFDLDNSDSKVWERHQEYRDKNRHFGIIDVVTNETLPNIKNMYNFYKEKNIPVVFNDCFETKEKQTKNLAIKTGSEYEKYYSDYIDYWIRDKNGVKERYVSSAIENLFKSSNLCVYSDCRKNWLGIHPDGYITPCDRLVSEKYRFGDIEKIDNIYDIYNSKGFKAYFNDIQKRYDNICKPCGLLDFCGGGCNGTIEAKYPNELYRVNETHCVKFREKLKLTYKHIRNIDIYRDDLNPEFKKIVFDNFIYLPKEIIELLSELNVNTNDIIWDENNYIFSKEFLLFKEITNKISLKCKREYKLDLSKIDNIKKTRKEIFFNKLLEIQENMKVKAGE